MQTAKRDCDVSSTRDLNIWLCGRQSDLIVKAWKTFLGQSIGVGETNTFQLKFFLALKLWAPQCWTVSWCSGPLSGKAGPWHRYPIVPLSVCTALLVHRSLALPLCSHLPSVWSSLRIGARNSA